MPDQIFLSYSVQINLDNFDGGILIDAGDIIRRHKCYHGLDGAWHVKSMEKSEWDDSQKLVRALGYTKKHRKSNKFLEIS